MQPMSPFRLAHPAVAWSLGVAALTFWLGAMGSSVEAASLSDPSNAAAASGVRDARERTQEGIPHYREHPAAYPHRRHGRPRHDED
jgi:hypothetical protein